MKVVPSAIGVLALLSSYVVILALRVQAAISAAGLAGSADSGGVEALRNRQSPSISRSPDETAGGTRSRLVGLLRSGEHEYLGHPNGDVGWTRDLTTARSATIKWPNGESGASATRLESGAERSNAIRATSQHPFPGNLIYRLARRHIRAVGVYFRLETTDHRRLTSGEPSPRDLEGSMSLLPLIFFVAFVILGIAAIAVTFVPEQRAHQLAMERQRARFGTGDKARDDDGDGKIDVRYPGRRLFILGAILALAAWIFFLGVVIVPAGYVGVVRFLGQVQPAVLYPGASWVIPFVNTVEEVDTRVQPHNFQQLTAATAENLQVTVTGTMNYHLDPAFAGQLIQNVGTDFASKIIDPAFSDYIKQVTPAYSADSNSPTFILNKRDEIRRLTREQLGENLSRYNIIVDDIYIVDIGYPQAYNDSITSEAGRAAERAARAADPRTEGASRLSRRWSLPRARPIPTERSPRARQTPTNRSTNRSPTS